MARRGFLDYVLGGAVGGLEGLAQKRAAEEEKKRMADAAAMDRARLLMQLNYRVAPDEYDTIDPAARSILPSLEMPSTARSALPPMTMPSTAPRPSAGVSGALSAALNRDFKVDPTQPSITRPGFGAPPLAMDGGGSRMTEMFEAAKDTRAAQEAIAASVDLGGGLKVRFNAPETAAQIASRTRTESDAKRSQELSQALSALTPEQLKEYEPLVRASFAGVPSNVLSSILTPREGRARRTQLIPETGQIVDLDTGEIVRAKGYTIPPKGAIAGSQPTQEELDEADAASVGELGPYMKAMVDALRARGDKRPDAVLNLAAYRVLKARAVLPTSVGGLREDSGLASLLNGGFGSNPAAAGVPGGAPAAAAPVVPVAPVVPPKPAPAPATSSDAAYKQSQRGALWESIKASNPTLSDADITAQVMRRIP